MKLFNNGYLAIEADFVYTTALMAAIDAVPRVSPLIAEADMSTRDVIHGY